MFAIFCGCVISFDEVLDACGDVHPLEPAVTIGRTSRTVADGIVVDCRTDPRLFARRSSVYYHGSRIQVSHIVWFQPYVWAGRGSLLEHVFHSAAY